jgi:hypothetical protein
MMKKLLIALGVVALLGLNLFLVKSFLHFGPRSRAAGPLPTGAAIEEPRRQANQDIARLFVDIDRYCAQTGMVRLDSALVASGWTRYGGGIPSMLTNYYDRNYGPDRPNP